MAIESFAEQYLSASFQPPLAAEEVRRVAFEGGGGKGNAYLGALFAFDQLRILEQLDVVAGSSAGAITALALTLGMRPHEVYEFMATTNFGRFFDQPSDAMPAPGRPYDHPSKDELPARRIALGAWTGVVSLAELPGQIKAALKAALAPESRTALLSTLLTPLYSPADVAHLFAIMRLRASDATRAALIPPAQGEPPLTTRVLEQLVQSSPQYLTSVSQEMGVFSGEVARDRFAELIAERIGTHTDLATGQSVAEGQRVDGQTVTFAELDRFALAHNHPRLRVTGSELCSLKSVIFSGETTANFPVADAVRISMGLPLVYKPYTLKSTGHGLPPCGVYVDGGVFSNLPLLALSDEEARAAIGARLEVEFPTPINGFLGMLSQIAKASLLAGESSVTPERAKRSVRLDTEPLGLFDFAPDLPTLATVVARAHLTTLHFFGQGACFKPMDLTTGQPVAKPDDAASRAQAARVKRMAEQELELSVERRRSASRCVFDMAR